MTGNDPHIHVDSQVVRDDAAVRDLIASTFGLVGDLPGIVTTGCGLTVPYAMTSPRPDRVTCLACREHARHEHLRFAEQIERLSRMAGSTIGPTQAKQAADRHRDLAQRFSDGGGMSPEPVPRLWTNRSSHRVRPHRERDSNGRTRSRSAPAEASPTVIRHSRTSSFHGMA
ncbi:hypothetical protein [Streptomyces sp. NPDC003077]|uniref:hypothetical protein n=1 Tax=Streptomyces sp. NPDC003077 TaxID=3154443 RepID=UPI0033AE9575